MFSAPSLPPSLFPPMIMALFSVPPLQGHCLNFKQILETAFLILLTIESIA